MTGIERVIVVGNTGSGKSTLAEELARRLDLEFIEYDALHWLPGWQEREPEAFRERLRAAIAGGRWATAGNYTSKVLDITWPEAQVVVHLDLGLRLSLWRVTSRAWRRWRTQELLWGTNTETFGKHLRLWSEDSLLHWAVKSHLTRRPRLLALRGDPRWAHLDFVRLRSPREVERWLESVAPLSPRAAADERAAPSSTRAGVEAR